MIGRQIQPTLEVDVFDRNTPLAEKCLCTLQCIMLSGNGKWIRWAATVHTVAAHNATSQPDSVAPPSVAGQ